MMIYLCAKAGSLDWVLWICFILIFVYFTETGLIRFIAQSKIGYGWRARRKPILFTRSSGMLSLRYDARTPSELLPQ